MFKRENMGGDLWKSSALSYEIRSMPKKLYDATELFRNAFQVLNSFQGFSKRVIEDKRSHYRYVFRFKPANRAGVSRSTSLFFPGKK